MLPSVAFFPGAAGAGEFWSPVADLLPHGWSKRLLSWPGAGMVPSIPEVSGYRDLIELAAAELPDHGDVVAQSMGGVVAIGLALARPLKVRRLILVATSGGLGVEALGARDWREEYREQFPQAGAWVTRDRIDHTSLMATIEQPICLIWGDADPISPVAVGARLNETFVNSELHVLPGGTHELALERPAEVASLIERHLAGSASG